MNPSINLIREFLVLGVSNDSRILSVSQSHCSLSEFLMHLFSDKSLAPSMVKGYRSAIAAMVVPPFDHVIGHSSELSQLV